MLKDVERQGKGVVGAKVCTYTGSSFSYSNAFRVYAVGSQGWYPPPRRILNTPTNLSLSIIRSSVNGPFEYEKNETDEWMPIEIKNNINNPNRE